MTRKILVYFMMTQRLRNREVLYQEVHNQIEPEAIEAMITYVQDTIGDSKLYGGIDIKHALYLMLNKYCYNKSNKGLEKQLIIFMQISNKYLKLLEESFYLGQELRFIV